MTKRHQIAAVKTRMVGQDRPLQLPGALGAFRGIGPLGNYSES